MIYLVAAEIPKYLCRYMLRFGEEPACLNISGNPRQPPDGCCGIWRADSVLFPANLTVKLLHRFGLRAGLGKLQLVAADDRAQEGSRTHDRGGKIHLRD